MGVGVRHFDHTHSAAQSSAVHRTAKFPIVGLFVVDLDRLEIGSAIKASYCIELPIDYGQSHLKI